MEMPGVEAYLKQQPHFPKFRIAKSRLDSVEWTASEKPMAPKQLVLATLLEAGDDDCVTIFESKPVEIDFKQQEQMSTGSLFTDDGEDAQIERDKKAEEEKRRIQQEEDARKKAEQEKQKQEKPKKKGLFERLKGQFHHLMDDENE